MCTWISRFLTSFLQRCSFASDMWSFSYVLWYMYTGMPAPRCLTDEPTCVMCLQEEVMNIFSMASSFYETLLQGIRVVVFTKTIYSRRFWTQLPWFPAGISHRGNWPFDDDYYHVQYSTSTIKWNILKSHEGQCISKDSACFLQHILDNRQILIYSYIITHMLELPWHLFITSVHLPTPLNKNKSGRGESLSPILSQGVGRYTQICACYHRRLNYSTSRLFKSTAFWRMSLPWLFFFFTQNYTCCGMKNGATSICRCFKVLILCHCYNWKTCLLLSFAASHNYAAMLMTSF